MNAVPVPFDFAVAIRSALAVVCELGERECRLLRNHFELLQRWNRRINLTSLRDPVEIVLRHYCESVFVGMHLPEAPISVVDVGSGAGFPGVGVAVMRPSAAVTLVESNQRKATFLRESTREIPNVRVLACRAEAVNERFDWLVSRAIAWEELSLLGEHVALLGTEPGPDFNWTERHPLPWGARRTLFIGRVPRETSA